MTLRKIIQDYLAIFLAGLFLALDLIYDVSSALDMERVMEKSIDIASISFGFLLAVLALLIQGENAALTRIKASGTYPKLIILNKKAVLASGLLVILSLLYLGFKLDKLDLEAMSLNLSEVLNSLVISVLIYQLAVVFSFLDIFYYIIKQES